MWTWQAKGAPLVAVPGLNPINTDYFQLGVPKNAAHPNLAKLFVAFMASKEAQAVLQKHESRSSHLVEGTMMAKYLRENRVAGPGAERVDIVLPQRRLGGRFTVQGRSGEDTETMNRPMKKAHLRRCASIDSLSTYCFKYASARRLIARLASGTFLIGLKTGLISKGGSIEDRNFGS